MRDSPPLVASTVAEMLERSRINQFPRSGVVLWADSLLAYAAVSGQRLAHPTKLYYSQLDRPLE